jgi:hypothetical protein
VAGVDAHSRCKRRGRAGAESSDGRRWNEWRGDSVDIGGSCRAARCAGSVSGRGVWCLKRRGARGGFLGLTPPGFMMTPSPGLVGREIVGESDSLDSLPDSERTNSTFFCANGSRSMSIVLGRSNRCAPAGRVGSTREPRRLINTDKPQSRCNALSGSTPALQNVRLKPDLQTKRQAKSLTYRQNVRLKPDLHNHPNPWVALRDQSMIANSFSKSRHETNDGHWTLRSVPNLHWCTDARKNVESSATICHVLPQFEARGDHSTRRASRRMSDRHQRIGAGLCVFPRLKKPVADDAPHLPRRNALVVHY